MDQRIKWAIIGGLIGFVITIGILWHTFSGPTGLFQNNSNSETLAYDSILLFGLGSFLVSIIIIPLTLFGLIVGWMIHKNVRWSIFIFSALILLIIFIAAYWGFYKISVPNYENKKIFDCESLKSNGEKLVCINEKLRTNENPEQCSTLQSSYLQGFCYSQLAIEKNDSTLCKEIIDDQYKKYCKDYFAYQD